MTFNTGNNVPSTDPRDLYDNAENLDKLVNGVDPFYADRKGILRESWAGMENTFATSQTGRENAFTLSQADKESRFQAFLVSSGYVSKGDYAANVVLVERNEYVAVDAATTGTTAGLYRPGPGATLPLTLTGTWAADKTNLVLLGDDVLRQELASASGGGIVGFDPEAAYPAGTVGHKLSDQISATQGRGSLMQYVPEAERAAILAGTSSFDCTAALKQAVDENDFVLVGPGHYGLLGDVQVVKPTIVWGAGGTLYQKSVNTRLLWSNGVNDVAYIGLKVRGYGASDTASTYNADANTANAMARGLDFWNGQRFTAVNCDVRGFKNYGIQAAYSSFVTITGNHIEGTYPDADIPLLDTGRQQMGVQVYAKWYAAENATVASVVDGSAAPHGNHTIEVSNNQIGNTAIAICALPGFGNVRMDGNTTFGGLTQHSFYAYPADGLQVTNNICGADPQSVGVKISNNVGANRREVKNVSIRGNLIKHTSGPGVSVEIFDRLLDNSFVTNKSGSFFNGVMLQDNTVEDFHDIGMSLACVHGGLVAGNVFKNQNGAGGSRTVLDLRSFGGIIEGNRCEDVQYSFIGGSGVLDEPAIIRDNYLNNVSNAVGGAYMALSVAIEPMLVEPTHWYTAGNLVYNSGNGQVYRVTQTGYTGSTIPTGTAAGTETSGGVTFEWFGAFTSLMTKVDVYDNILDATKATASTIALSLNNAKFQSKVKGNWAIPAASTAQVQGRIDLWSGNNLRNTSKSAQLASGDGAAGPNRNDWNGTAIPTTGRFEKGDVVWNSNPAASGVIGWVCTGAGTPGTWKSFGTIAA